MSTLFEMVTFHFFKFSIAFLSELFFDLQSDIATNAVCSRKGKALHE